MSTATDNETSLGTERASGLECMRYRLRSLGNAGAHENKARRTKVLHQKEGGFAKRSESPYGRSSAGLAQVLGQCLLPAIRVAKPTGVVEHAKRALVLEHERRKTLPAHTLEQLPALVDVFLD